MATRIHHPSKNDVAERVETLKDDLIEFKEDVVGLIESIMQAGKATGAELTEGAQREAAERIEAMRKRIDLAQDRGRQALDKTKQTIARHPFVSVLAAVGAGFVAARFFRS